MSDNRILAQDSPQWKTFPKQPATYIVTYLEFPQYFKIGYSSCAHKRIDDFQIAMPFDIHIVKLVLCHSSVLALFIERCLHERLKAKLKRGEWYSLNQRDIDQIKSIGDFTYPERGTVDLVRNELNRVFDVSDFKTKLGLFNIVPLQSLPCLKLLSEKPVGEYFTKKELKAVNGNEVSSRGLVRDGLAIEVWDNSLSQHVYQITEFGRCILADIEELRK